MSDEMLVRADGLSQLPGLPPLLRRHALVAMAMNGLSVAAWLKSLSLEEIDEAMLQLRRCQTDQDLFTCWTLFGVMLANGEGMVVPMASNLGQLLRRLFWLLQAEMLYREGLAELDHSTLSLETFELSQLKLLPVRNPGAKDERLQPRLRIVNVPLPGERD